MASRGSASEKKNAFELGRKHFLSKSALGSVLEEVAAHGLPDARSRHSIKRSRDRDLNEETPHGPLLRTVMVETSTQKAKLVFVNPAALLQRAAGTDSDFSQHLHARLTCPATDTGWTIVVYSDEVSPGNVLRHVNHRKIQALYWTLLELGPASMGTEQHWFLLGVMRSEIVKQLPGGMSRYFKEALNQFRQAPSVDHGWQLCFQRPSGTEHVFLKARVGAFIADEAALKEVLDFKGASGTVLCPLCANVVQASSRLSEHDPSLQPHTSLDMASWKRHSDESVRRCIVRLSEQCEEMPKTRFKRLEQAAGFNFNPNGILNDAEFLAFFRPISTLTFDFMHCYLVNGIWHLEFSMLLRKLKAHGIPPGELHDYAQQFSWPEHISSRGVSGKNMLAKLAGDCDVKSSASEALSFYGVVRLFLFDKAWEGLLDACKNEVSTYVALAKVLDLFIQARTGSISPVTLHTAIKHHQQLSQTTYGAEHWLPKYHYSMHIPEALQRYKTVLSCFVQERRHRHVKRYAQAQTNTMQGFEEYVTRETVSSQLHHLQHDKFKLTPALDKPQRAGPATIAFVRQWLRHDESIEELWTSSAATYGAGKHCSVGDVVTLLTGTETITGQIQLLCSTGFRLLCGVQLWTARGSHRWTPEEAIMLCDLTRVQSTHVWACDKDESRVVL